jgi:DNA mismatch endonuclease (patch repair protein)
MTKLAPPTTNIDPERSAQMARVKGRDTGPELKVRRALHRAGMRFRLQDRRLPGKPDIVLAGRRLAIFVHGCFWHRHPDPACKLARLPKSRLDFWIPKLEANRARDERNASALADMGWEVRTIWECELNDGDALARFVEGCRLSPIRVGPRRKLD